MNMLLPAMHFDASAEPRSELDATCADQKPNAPQSTRAAGPCRQATQHGADGPESRRQPGGCQPAWPQHPAPLPRAELPGVAAQTDLFIARATRTARQAFVQPQPSPPAAVPLDASFEAGKVLPSFALQQLEQYNSAVPAISPPVLNISPAAQARIYGRDKSFVLASIFEAASQQSAAGLARTLAVQPRAIRLLHPDGHNLLHHVVRHCSLEHVGAVLAAAQTLPPSKRIGLLDGLCDHGRDAVLLAIDRGAVVMLAKLLEAGCDPTRRRIKPKFTWYAYLVHPMRPQMRLEDACMYAMHSGLVPALDLLLLWDEQRCVHRAQASFAFDISPLMAAATGIEQVRLRTATIDVLHAAQKRRRPLPVKQPLQASCAPSPVV